MKFFIFALFFVFVKSEIDFDNFDWSSVKPLHEIQEWRKVHSNAVPMEDVHRPPRIINGEIASIFDFPYMAGILLHFDTGNSWCGGSLISSLFVLTAANCVHIVPSSSVLLGTSNTHNVEQNIRVAKMMVHPLYTASSSANDIATLQLLWLAELSLTVAPVRLPNRRQVQATFENQQGTVSGWVKLLIILMINLFFDLFSWGRTATSGVQAIPTQFLRFLRSPIISNLSCRIRFPSDITASSICTDPNDGTPCTGDHGGPLMVVEADGRRTQIGVFSFHFSLGCGLGWPAVYTRVTSFLDFIESHSDVRILETWDWPWRLIMFFFFTSFDVLVCKSWLMLIKLLLSYRICYQINRKSLLSERL